MMSIDLYWALSLVAMITSSVNALPASTGVDTRTVYGVRYKIDYDRRIIDVLSVNNKSCSVEVIAPNGRSSGRGGDLDLAHHFPGAIVTDIVFDVSAVNSHTVLHVLLDNGSLLRVVPDRVYTNFHTHNWRMVYGQLRTFAVDDFTLANRIYIGAPIFLNGKLVSVVTCRYDEYDLSLAMFPVSGIRSPGLVSGQIHFDDEVIVKNLRVGMSVYGKMQLPYNNAQVDNDDNKITNDANFDDDDDDDQNGGLALNAKRFAISATNNRRMYRNLPRTVAVFHDRDQVSIGLVEGEFEINRVRFDGPLIVPQGIDIR
ncbi:P26-1 [Artaxa digramma nucleopolyhedrovirus]|uniref:P26-1 n=1 Tax=Artaxa digramma nucleopolyhedrovirus TaxID=3070910 RepID=A0AAE6UZS0_9ABAC|nr:P26-1 [Euproctis digramma nucleopolyhedrovirus]QHB21712.1 P26-1 [Artaxa digramma nucleopolyhedrovirus]